MAKVPPDDRGPGATQVKPDIEPDRQLRGGAPCLPSSGGRADARTVLNAKPSPPGCPRAVHRKLPSRLVRMCLAAIFASGFSIADEVSAETWRGLVVAPEHRCAPYDRARDYPYPPTVEHAIVRALGAIYEPYTGRCFASSCQTDIEHIVATSEAHDSGLCAADAATRARFARDVRNLTLASPEVNRHAKGGKDAGEWVPNRNRCWFAGRIVEVRRVYGLTIDRREAAALEAILAACAHTDLEPVVCETPAASGVVTAPVPAADDGPLARYDDNRNGRITCKEARRHGIAPVPRAHPAYRYMRDGDGDGIVCE